MGDIAADDPRSIAIGPFGSRLKSDLYTSSGIPVLRGQDITEGSELATAGLAYVPEDIAMGLSSCIVRRGDLVFPHRGAIGRVGLVGEQDFLMSSSMMKLSCDQSKANPNFLFYYFRGPGRDELLTRASTVGTPGIGQPLRSLRGINIDLPPVDEQGRISAVLGALDDKIDANRKLAEDVDEYLAAVLGTALDCSKSQNVRIDEIAMVNRENVKPVSGGYLRYIDISSVGVGGYEFPELAEWDDAPSRARRRVVSGDILWSTVRPNRRSHALNLSNDASLVASTGLAVLTPIEVGSVYLYEVLRRPEFTAHLESVAEGSAYPAVRQERFAEAVVPLVSIDQREEFEALATPLRESVHAAENESRSLSAIRDALLPQLMSGKLRVRDAEKQVEAVL